MMNAKNLYIKSWYLSEANIESKLTGSPLTWKRIGRQFFFMVSPDTFEDVLSAIAPLNRENGSMIHESDIDYVNGTEEEIEKQIRDLYSNHVILSSTQRAE